ncbi:MAG TPA: hypothetical protein VMB23_06740 [Spirochaetia bacterium]|nr:hypothetical protein [Spirochaetia bacterium]
MNKLNIDPVRQDKIKMELLDNAEGLKVTFVGDIDMEDPSIVLDPFFEKIHQGMVAKKIPFIVADFTGLTFLNSSGIKAVAKWIMKLAMLPPDQKYQIRIAHNKAITWQVTSLPTLTFLVPGAVKVE